MSGRRREAALDETRFETKHLEQSRPDNVTYRRDAHTRHHFTEATFNDAHIHFCCLLACKMLKAPFSCQRAHGSKRQRGYHSLGPLAEQERDLMDIPGGAGFTDQGYIGAQSTPDEGLVDRTDGKQHGHREFGRTGVAIADDQ